MILSLEIADRWYRPCRSRIGGLPFVLCLLSSVLGNLVDFLGTFGKERFLILRQDVDQSLELALVDAPLVGDLPRGLRGRLVVRRVGMREVEVNRFLFRRLSPQKRPRCLCIRVLASRRDPDKW